MARVVLTGGLLRFTEGTETFELDGATVRQLFRQLAALYPDLEPHLEEGIAVVINGQMYQDAWLEQVPPDSEVFLLPQIAGG
ncbi:MAG: MoaD/ThiS family protein [Alphaproteobacteria bacterium]|nr:MoaD/ThiS family protein [Alphaproteobacteria bacterium]